MSNKPAKAAIDIITEFNTGLEESIEVEYNRTALISALGTESVVQARGVFVDTWNAATEPLGHPERFERTDDALRTEAIRLLTDGLQALEAPIENLRIAIRGDLLLN